MIVFDSFEELQPCNPSAAVNINNESLFISNFLFNSELFDNTIIHKIRRLGVRNGMRL
ncbi:protein of unknown function [Moritella yayanosii]|uniref:Uncharacterized protein n=1 Tax=Moritella yayanosii TaxID=69539 RepID=A0A330LW93_9GAMM|nr:protein of unknown function [Moritella yayanosii]